MGSQPVGQTNIKLHFQTWPRVNGLVGDCVKRQTGIRMEPEQVTKMLVKLGIKAG